MLVSWVEVASLPSTPHNYFAVLKSTKTKQSTVASVLKCVVGGIIYHALFRTMICANIYD